MSSSNFSCDTEDTRGGGHKITLYVNYSGCVTNSNVPLVEASVDSDTEPADTDQGSRSDQDTVIHCDNDTITICDTRVRLRLCAATSVPSNGRRKQLNSGQFVPVKRKDLFKLLGLNESSDILDPCEEADAKKLALQNFLCSADKASSIFIIVSVIDTPID